MSWRRGGLERSTADRERPAPRRRLDNVGDLSVGAQSVHGLVVRRRGGTCTHNRRSAGGSPGSAHGDARCTGDADQGRVHLHGRRTGGEGARPGGLGQLLRTRRQSGGTLLFPLPLGRLGRPGRRTPECLHARGFPGGRKHQYRRGFAPRGRSSGAPMGGCPIHCRQGWMERPRLAGRNRGESTGDVRLRTLGRAQFPAARCCRRDASSGLGPGPAMARGTRDPASLGAP